MEANEGSLHPKLDEAQKALSRALDEACDVDVNEADTGEFIRVEEALASASKAAKDAVSVRLRLRKERERSGGDAEEKADPTQGRESNGHRVFEDADGKEWHVFAVQPSTGTTERKALPEAYRSGWLAFESQDQMRRVAPIPPNWKQLSVEELRVLCRNAQVAPKRIQHIDTPPPPPPPPPPPAPDRGVKP